MSERKKIVEKINKLLSLAQGAGTEAEAELAMQRAHEILAKHNLIMADVEFAENDPIKKVQMDGFSVGRAWERLIYQYVGELYFCDFFYAQRRGCGARYTFVGRDDNIKVAQNIARYVCTTCDRLAKRAIANSNNQSSPRTIAASFRSGFSQRIALRCKGMIKQAKQNKTKDSSTGTDLVLSPLYDKERNAIADYMKQQDIKVSSRSSRHTIGDKSAFQEGVTAASKVCLHDRGIHADQESRLKIGNDCDA